MTSGPGGPFVGPRPFEAADRHLFFGRDREAYEVSSLVLANRLFVLYAMSGAGKTSLVNAGVLPLVQDELEVLPTARFLVSDPSDAGDAANVYTRAVLSCWTEPGELGRLQRTTLGDFLATRERVIQPIGGPKPRLLVFDQFEELFTAYPDRWHDRSGFLEQLTEAIDADQGLRVLVVLREDFLSRILAFADTFYSGLKDRYFLEPLRKPAAELAITGPVRNTGRSFEPDAVEDLVRKLSTSRVDLGDSRIVQVEGEFVEPVLLQVVCQKLWAELPAGVSAITAADIRDVETSLADFYSDAVRRAAELGHIPERQIREWVEQSLLTHPGGTRGTVHVGPQTTAGLPNETVDLLVGTLLRAEFRAGARWLEITHDSLLGPIEQSNAAFFRAEGPLSREADVLALAVSKSLQSTLTARRLNDPAPLEVSWTAAEPAVMDPWEEVARPQSGARWIPPAGIWVKAPADLAGSGNLADLIDRLPGRRLVVAGDPGSGKTILLTRLALDLLARRATGGPVPVLVSAASWNPVAQDLPSWLAEQLAGRLADLVAARQLPGHAMTAGSALLAAGLVLPVIDDLDELAPGTRRLAISRINDSLRPGDFLVAACRTQQYQQAATASDGTQAMVRSAAVIQLEPLAADEMGRYLSACADSAEAMASWEPVLTALGTGTPVGQALQTPLMAGLARARYSRGPSAESGQSPSPAELLDPRLADRAAVEELLFGSFIPMACAASTVGRWQARKTEHWLSFLAGYQENTAEDRSLRWWQLTRATPRYVLGLATGLAIGLLAAAIVAESLDASRLVAGEVAAGVVLGLVLGFGLASDRRTLTGSTTAELASAGPRAVLMQARRTALRAATALGVAVGAAAGVAAGFGFGVARGVIAGLLAAIMAGLISAAYSSAWLRWQLARAWLAVNGKLPWRPIAFLDHAHALGALRQEGSRYQFRYPNLRRRLSAQLLNSGEARASQREHVTGVRPGRRLRAPVAAALALLIVVTGALVASQYLTPRLHHAAQATNSPRPHPTGSPSPHSTPPPAPGIAQAQAGAVNNLLTASTQARGQWDANTLVTDVANCVDLKSDVTQIQDIAAERTEEVREANRLVTNALPGGGVLKSQLITALLISLNIDTEYLAWAQQQQSSGCSVGTDSAPYEDATSLDAEATADKTEFCNTWNAVAIEYGLTEFSAGQI
ncbi:MAG TPA: NACHT domain-containing protein [Streptosporangiaceae bacterium]|nr:NACHT domain-containing protein [Streptosporangiaceae bacterium]